jgi:hypothetical protein
LCNFVVALARGAKGKLRLHIGLHVQPAIPVSTLPLRPQDYGQSPLQLRLQGLLGGRELVPQLGVGTNIGALAVTRPIVVLYNGVAWLSGALCCPIGPVRHVCWLNCRVVSGSIVCRVACNDAAP